MRLALMFVLLAGAWSWGAASAGPANDKSYTPHPSSVLEEIQPKSSLLKYETAGFNKNDEDNGLSSLPEGDNKQRLSVEEIIKPTADGEANENNEKDVELQPSDGEKEPLNQNEKIKDSSALDKTLNSQLKGDLQPQTQEKPLLAKGEAPLAGDYETLTNDKEHNTFIYKGTVEDEEVKDDDDDDDDDDDEKTIKLLSGEKESLVKDEEMVKLQTQELKLMSSSSQAVQKDEEKQNASNVFKEPKIYQQNETTRHANELDEDIVSVLQLESENKTKEDEKYTVFVFQEKSDGEITESQEEDDNTWFIFEEDESDEVDYEEDAASESLEESDEIFWLTFEEDDDYLPSLQRNSTVLTGEPTHVDNIVDNVVSHQDKGYGEASDHTVNYINRFDDVEDFSDHENKNQNSLKEEYLNIHFYAYLAATAAVVIVLFAVYHYNRKIIAFVTSKWSGGGCGASDANYHSLHNKV